MVAVLEWLRWGGVCVCVCVFARARARSMGQALGHGCLWVPLSVLASV